MCDNMKWKFLFSEGKNMIFESLKVYEWKDFLINLYLYNSECHILLLRMDLYVQVII
jgi:hypothetical protein